MLLMSERPNVRTSNGSTNVRLWARRVRSFHPICAEHQRHRRALTKAGNTHPRRSLSRPPGTYRHRPALGDRLARHTSDQPPAVVAEAGDQLEKNLARKKLQHQAIHLGRVLVRGPVAGLGNPVHVERADGLADLADQESGGAESGNAAPPPPPAGGPPPPRPAAPGRPPR